MAIDTLKTLTAPYATFFSGGKFAPRSQAMDQNLQDIIRDQIATTGKGSGIIGYQDFDKTQSPNATFDENNMMKSLFTGKMNLPEFANATTLGRLTYDVDPNTGKVSFGSNTYNFRPEVANSGGIFEPFAKMANERNREINPNITVPVDELRGFARDFSQFDQAKMGTAKENDLMDYDEFYDMPEEKEKEGIFAALKDKIDPSTLLSFLANVYTGGTKQALTGTGIAKAFGNIRGAIGNRLGPSPYGTSQAAFNAMTPSQQQAVGSIYGPGGIMQGYNAVSAFGRGPAGAIQNRIDNMLGRKAAGKKFSAKNLAALQAAAGQVGGGGSGDYGSSGYEGMSDAASDQERSEGGRGSRG
tara:strand:+ start:109 stop:1179 length:1071 start_codon:yes stop_codon:yes gene_type:complete